MKAIDITGQRFGRLVALEPVREPGWRTSKWRLKCDCGGEVLAMSADLRKGGTISCGCKRKEQMGALRRTHGTGKTSTYNSWIHLRNRCLNEKHRRFHDWGGRGIKVCERWNSFENFLADMGEKPAPNLSIDRIDNNGDYEPGNCRWATAKEQRANQRPKR